MNEKKPEIAEEKKAESPGRPTPERLFSESEGSAGRGVEIEFEDDPEDFGDATELVPLTDELKIIFGDKKFKTEEELHHFMNEAGIADFRVILVGEALYLRIPTDQHNRFTSRTIFKFASRHGSWGYVTGTHNVHLSTNKRREPDVSFFGAPRCVADADGDLGPYDDGAVPDVVIQFSWRNKRGYEEQAIDEMMNDAVEIERGPASLTCPRVGYLIKVRFKKKRSLANAMKGSKTQDMGGLDVYRLPHGTTVNDAINGDSGASKFTYIPGGQDRHIDIAPQDLGFTPPVAWNGFQIQLSRIFDEMDAYNKKRQQNHLAT